MKVLYIVDPGVVGGATLTFIEMVNQMKSRGIDCIVCTSKRNSLNDKLDMMGIDNIPIGHNSVLEPDSPYKWKRPLKYPIRWIQYRIALKRALNVIDKKINLSEIDLIHTNSHRNDIGCFLNKKYGIPHIVHIREFSDLDFNCISYRRDFIKFMNRYTTRYIAISDAIKKHWIKKGFDEKKISRIYNGISFKNSTISNKESKTANKIKMVITSGICFPKGQHLVVAAMEKIPEEIRNNITVDFVGWDDPQYTKLLKDKIAKNGMTNLFRFVGPVENAKALLGNYQIGLMCSRSEGFGRVTAEYMYAQLGVIASDSGANPELIDNGINGLLFKSGNENNLAEKILTFYNDRNLLIACAEHAHVDAINKYTDDLYADNIYNFYQTIQ